MTVDQTLQLAIAQHKALQLLEAERLYRSILLDFPLHADANHNLGILALQLDQASVGLQHLKAALDAQPHQVQYCLSYAQALLATGKASEALQLFESALLRDLDTPAIRALRLKDKDCASSLPQAEYNRLVALFNAGQAVQLENLARALLVSYPESGFVWMALGAALQSQGKDALPAKSKAAQLSPDDAEAHYNLGNALKIKGPLAEAVASFRRALQIKPDYAAACNNLGLCLQELGQLSAAAASYRQAMLFKPDFAEAHSNLLFCLTHDATVDARDLYLAHCQFGLQFESGLSSAVHSNQKNRERCLRVGFVSADLRTHAVTDLFEAVLAHLSRSDQVSLYAYSNHVLEDAVSQRLKRYFTQWQVIAGLDDAAVDSKIRSDQIDILIDLSGHSGKNRLPLFARKPAPLQISWIGYPGTTGLQAMDYYLGDHFFIPDQTFAAQFIENIVYLPAAATFMPFLQAPLVNSLPAIKNGHITFGSFNRLNKLNRKIIAVWSRLLRTMPESRMLLGSIPPEGCATLAEWFALQGIPKARLDFLPRVGAQEYLALYHQVDICLDAFPYNSGTTTAHALWMGVPTLTLAGSTPASRAGASILAHMGLQSFIAHDQDEFVAKGLKLAQDTDGLALIRMGLRTHCEQSAFSRPELTTAALLSALRLMWCRWCDDLPPIALDLSQPATENL